MKFLKEYVLNKEAIKVLPIQMKHFTEDELNQGTQVILQKN